MKTTTPTERLKELLPQLFEENRAAGERYLLFQITSDMKAAISLDQVWEATILPLTAITPIPQMPSYVLGWNNGRDRVYCVIDLGEFLELTTSSKIPQQYPTIVVQVPSHRTKTKSSLLLGLTVHGIIRTVTLPTEAIMPSVGEFSSKLTPYLKGCLVGEEETIAVIDLATISQQIAQS